MCVCVCAFCRATTHSDLVLRAVNAGIPYRVIHNASIMNAVGCCGLQVFNPELRLTGTAINIEPLMYSGSDWLHQSIITPSLWPHHFNCAHSIVHIELTDPVCLEVRTFCVRTCVPSADGTHYFDDVFGECDLINHRTIIAANQRAVPSTKISIIAERQHLSVSLIC